MYVFEMSHVINHNIPFLIFKGFYRKYIKGTCSQLEGYKISLNKNIDFRKSLRSFNLKKICRVGLVVSMSASEMVGRRFEPRLGHTKDHHKNGTNCLPA